jgi:glycosyltransferase involved in cell wall biosynthesis
LDAGTDIKSMIYEYGISDYVIMSQDNTRTPKRELYKRYRCCDCYIGLPLAEGFGYGFFEAMQSGLPIIYHNVGGISQYLKDSSSYPVSSIATMRPNNYFCEWKVPNVDQAVQRMLEVANLSKTKLEEIKTNNQEYSKKFLWKSVYEQLDSIVDFSKLEKADIFNQLNIKRMA